MSDIDVGILAQDLRQEFDRQYPNKKKVNLVTLRSWAMSDGQTKQEDIIKEWPVRVPGEDPLLIDAGRLAEQIREECHKVASGVGGMVRFSVKLYVPGNTSAVRTLAASVYSDTITSMDLDTRMGIGELSGTERGEKQADLRHREQMARIYIGGAADIVKDLRAEVKELRAENKELRASYLRVVKIGETALSQHTERELMVSTQKKKSELMEQLFGKIVGNVHLIFNYLMGRGDAVVNLGEDQRMQAIGGFYRSLNDEHKARLQKFLFDFSSVLDPAQQSIVFRVGEEIQKMAVREDVKRIDSIATSMPSMQSPNG